MRSAPSDLPSPARIPSPAVGGAAFDAVGGAAYGSRMCEGSNYLDPNRPDAVRLGVGEARALGETALARIGYDKDDSRIVTDQLIDNSLCGYRFAGLPRILAIAREAKTRNARTPVAIVHETRAGAGSSCRKAATMSATCLDFGFTPDAEKSRSPRRTEQHRRADRPRHYDLFQRAQRFISKRIAKMRRICRPAHRRRGQFPPSDARAAPTAASSADGHACSIARLRWGSSIVPSEAPVIIEGHAFTTGAMPRTSTSTCRRKAGSQFGDKGRARCDPKAYMNHHFTRRGTCRQPQPDQHWHEHATCFRLGDRGLVVISSCGHAGIINTLRRAQEVSGVERSMHWSGRFHLAPAPDDYLRQVMAESKKFDLAHSCRCIAAARTRAPPGRRHPRRPCRNRRAGGAINPDIGGSQGEEYMPEQSMPNSP